MNTRLLFSLTLVCALAVQLSFSQETTPTVTGSLRLEKPERRAALELLKTAVPGTEEIPGQIRVRELEYSATLPIAGDIRNRHLLKTGSMAMQNWRPRGPFNVSGRIRALAVDITDPTNILAGGVSGGMWRSIDGGASWVCVSDPASLQTVSCIAQDTRPGKTHIWYRGSGEYYNTHQALYAGDGIWKSTDNGASWLPLQSTMNHAPQMFNGMKYVWKIVCDPNDLTNDIVYAAAMGGVFRSSDGGASWHLVLGKMATEGDPMCFSSDISITSDGVLYATMSTLAVAPGTGQISGSIGAAGGIFRSTDGIAWTSIVPEGMPASYSRIVSGITPSNENHVYFLFSTRSEGFQTTGVGGSVDYSSFWKYTYLSGNGSGAGGAWTNLTNNLPDFGNYGRFNTQGGYNLVVKVHPSNPDIVYLGATSLYRSTDGFSSNANTSWIGGYHHDFKLEAPFLDWLAISYPNHHPDVHEILFDGASTMYSATDGGIQRTDDCFADSVVWTSLNNGLFTTQFYALGIHPVKTGDETILGGMQDNGSYVSKGSGNEWVMVGSGDGFGCEISPDEDNTYYTSMYSGIVTKTVTDAQIIPLDVQRIAGQSLDNAGFDFVTEWLIDPADPNTAYIAGTDYIYRNSNIHATDVLTTWQQLTGSGPVRGDISAIAYSDGALIFGTTEGWLYRLDNARTSNEKAVRIDKGKLPFKSYISCIAVDRNNPGWMMVVLSNYSIPSLFATYDGGDTWRDVSGNLEEHPDGSGAGPSCRWAEMFSSIDSYLYLVGTSTGLYSAKKLEGSQTIWEKEAPTLIGNALVTCMRSRFDDGFGAGGTYGSGGFSSFVTTVGVEPAPAPPLTFYLEQNYPNPAVGETTVRFSVPSDQSVTLTLTDALGRRIRTVESGIVERGTHERVMSTANLPAGRYFLRLAGESQRQTRMLTVAK